MDLDDYISLFLMFGVSLLAIAGHHEEFVGEMFMRAAIVTILIRIIARFIVGRRHSRAPQSDVTDSE